MSPDFPGLGGPDDGPLRGLFSILNRFRIPVLIVLGGLIAGTFTWYFNHVGISFVVTPVCLGKNGAIDVTATSRSQAPISFTWKSLSDPSFTRTTEDVTGLAAGTYRLTATNFRQFGTTVVDIVVGGLESVSIDETRPTAIGSADGVLRVVTTPHGHACTYAWENGSNEPVRNGLDVGVYRVTVTSISQPACSVTLIHKLLGSEPATCPDWDDFNGKVLSLDRWSELLGPPLSPTPFYPHRNAVQGLIALNGGSIALLDCSGATLLTYSGAVPLLNDLRTHLTPPPVLGPWAATSATGPRNDLAAQLLVLRLNLLNVDEGAPAPTVLRKHAIYLGNAYHGMTVGRIQGIAERALGCGMNEEKQDLLPQDYAALYQTLVDINNGGLLLACAPCSSTAHFELIGDLPGGDVLGTITDISDDGLRIVGNSEADDPTIDVDGPNTGCAHCPQAIAYIRPCLGRSFFPSTTLPYPGFPVGNYGVGLIGLGYLPTTVHAESAAYGISPDGEIVVGYASKAPADQGCGTGRAVVFKGDQVVELGHDPAFTSSAARDVSDPLPVSVPVPSGPLGPKRRIAVGYMSTANNHSFKIAGARATYWDPDAVPHLLPDPPPLPNGAANLSSDATAVSNDGSVIGGLFYYELNSDGSQAKAPAGVWRRDASGGFSTAPLLLDDPPGGDANARITQVSGDGKVIVGAGVDASGFMHALLWRRQSTGDGWIAAPEMLPMLPGGEISYAQSVNIDGSVIVGSCNKSDFTAFSAAYWQAGSVKNVLDLFAAATPPLTLPAGWQLQAEGVSADGKSVTGIAYDPGMAQQGWVGRLP